MLGERGGLRCSLGWDQAHVGDASPVKSKGRVCRFGRRGGDGMGDMRLSAVVVESPQLDSTAEHLAFWRLFQMQTGRTGRKSGPRWRCCDRMGSYMLRNRYHMGAGNLITFLFLCLCASLHQQNMSGTVLHA